MLLILGLLVLVPCLALLTSFLLSPGGKSGGNKKNDGVKVSPLPAALPAPPLLGWRWGSPCRAGGPRDTLRFKGQLLAQPSRRVPVPPARLLPGQAVQGRLCSAGSVGSAGSGSALEGCVGGICCCFIARKMRSPLAAPREGAEAGPGEGTRDGGGTALQPGAVASAWPRPFVEMGGCMSCLPQHFSHCGWWGWDHPQLLSYKVPKGWCAAGWHMGAFDPLGSTPCAQCRESK